MAPRQVAEQLGVNVGTVCKWLRRFAQGGSAALHDRSSRPHRSPRRLAVERVATISALRRMRLSSPEIALSPPVSLVANELRRLGLNKLSRLEPKPPVMRYEQQTTGDHSRRKRGAGREYLHVCVDDHSRLAYTELLPDEKATAATCFLIRAADWFARHARRYAG